MSGDETQSQETQPERSLPLAYMDLGKSSKRSSTLFATLLLFVVGSALAVGFTGLIFAIFLKQILNTRLQKPTYLIVSVIYEFIAVLAICRTGKVFRHPSPGNDSVLDRYRIAGALIGCAVSTMALGIMFITVAFYE